MEQKNECEVCGEPLTAAQKLKLNSRGFVACDNVFCVRLLEQRKNMPANTFSAHFKFQQKRIKEQKALEQDKSRHKRAITEKEEQENTQILEEYNNRHTTKQKYCDVVALPQGLKAVTPIEPSRKETYLQHIRTVVEQANQYQSESEIPQDQHLSSRENAEKLDLELDSKPKLHALSDELCALCAGGCCTAGSDHAFISAVTIWRFKENGAYVAPESIVERYKRYIPEKSISNSCINQTDSGCGLPRELRSDVCNGFYCEAVRSLQLRTENDNVPEKVLVVQRDNTNWNRFERKQGNKVIEVREVSTSYPNNFEP